ncbi:hypothetical protein [Amycolatopsis sp. lyj-109]|uniref:hypothetical protein n=1 Tax=Amycolatopsis sp. lyj-109 TaxID=2789287 RepID=UPI00397C2F2C
MTSEDNALDWAPRDRGAPLLRQVVTPLAAPPLGRAALRKLLEQVLPGASAPVGELWMGEGAARPMSIPDLELLCALEAEGFDGLVWSELQQRLASYGIGIIGAWTANEEIYRRSRDKGRPVPVPQPAFTRDEQIALVYETVAEGIRLLRTNGIEEGGWCPDRGARLSTYFLGSCVLCFANACRKQLAARRRAAHDVLVGRFDWDESSVPSAEEVALAKIDVDAAFAGTMRKLARAKLPPDVVRLILYYLINEFEVPAIVELIASETVTCTARTVRAVRTAYRAYIKQQQREGGHHG